MAHQNIEADGRTNARAGATLLISSIPMQVLLCMVVYAWTWRFFVAFCFLPESAYDDYVILFSGCTYVPLAAFLAAGCLPLLFYWRRIRWHVVDPDMNARGFVFWILSPLVLAFTFYDYNYYFDHTHIVDRIAVVALWMLIFRHPGFLFPFACVVMMVFFQVCHPLPGGAANWPDKRLPLHVLFLLNAFLFVRVFISLDRWIPLLATLVMTGAFYAHAALSKLAIGPNLLSWFFEDNLAYLFVAAYKNGAWLSFLNEDQIVGIAERMQQFALAQNFLTLMIEGAAILILFSPWATRIILGASIILHLAILASSGIFFWKWIVMDLVMLVYAERFWRSFAPSRPAMTCRLLLVLVTTLFAFYELMTTGVLFAWWDTRHSKYCTYEVETVDGERVRLDPHYFAPYDLMFVQSRFYYAVPRKVIPGTFGVSHSYAAARAVNEIDPEGFPNVLASIGENFYNEREASAYRQFLQRYLRNAMKRGQKGWVPSWFPPPYHFQTSVPPGSYRHGSKVKTLYVYFEEYFFDDVRIQRLSRSEILRIPIDEQPPLPGH